MSSPDKPERKTALRVAKEPTKREAESKDEEESKAKKLKKEEESNGGETEEITAQVSDSQVSENPQPQQQQQPNAAANPKPNSGPQKPKKLSLKNMDDEKRWRIRQQLKLYLHAQQCLRRESLMNGAEIQCSVNYCKTMRDVLKHMPTCRSISSYCSVMYCSSTRVIVGHWNSCSHVSDCPICAPLRKLGNIERCKRNLKRQFEALDPADSQSNSSPPESPSRETANVQNVEIDAPAAEILEMDLERPIDVSNMSIQRPIRLIEAARNITLVGTHPSLSDIAAITDEQKRLIRLSESLHVYSNVDTPHSLDLDFNILPIPSRVVWDWHRKVFPVLRKHLIKELIQMRISTFEFPSIMERHLVEMTHTSRKIENMCFEEAESKSRYLYLLAERIYKMKTDFVGRQNYHKNKLNKIEELLETGQVSVPVDEPNDRLNQQRINQHQQAASGSYQQAASGSYQQAARPTPNIRILPEQPAPPWTPTVPVRPAPVPSVEPTPSTAPHVTLHLDLLMDEHQQYVLRQWYSKQRHWILERQQMEQTVPGSTGYYDTDDFTTL